MESGHRRRERPGAEQTLEGHCENRQQRRCSFVAADPVRGCGISTLFEYFGSGLGFVVRLLDLIADVQPFGAAVGERIVEGAVPGPPATPRAPTTSGKGEALSERGLGSAFRSW